MAKSNLIYKLTVLSIVFLFFTCLILSASEKNLKKELPKLLGATNIGTEFLLTFHPSWEAEGENNAIRIYVSSSVETNVTVEIPSISFKRTKKTIPNDVIFFHLTPQEAQPYLKTDRMRPRPADIFKSRAIYVKSDAPIICYGMNRFHQTSDGFLGLPISSLGKEYVVASYADPVLHQDYQRFQWLTSYTSIVGAYDGTTVDFTFNGVGYIPVRTHEEADRIYPRQTMRVYLDRGDVWLIPAMGRLGDLTGSAVRANKPVAVISGSFCAHVPVDIATCDFLIEQELPVNTWGNMYHIVPIANRLKNSYVAVFSKEDNTMIYRNGVAWANLNTGMGRNFLLRRLSAELAGPSAFTISSDINKPIAVTQYNTGFQDDWEKSDPFQMIITPMEQYQTEIVFNTPGIGDSYGFDENWINLVYLANWGRVPNDLELGTVNNGEVTWQRVNSFSPAQGYPLYTPPRGDGKSYFGKQIYLSGGDGVYRLRANDPFAAYAYGNSAFDTYGFPTSVGLADLYIPDSQAPIVRYTMDCLGNVPSQDIPGGYAYVIDTALTAQGEIISNLGLIYMVRDDSFNYIFEVAPFVAGESIRTNFSLRVINPLENAEARLVFTDRRGNITDTTISFHPTLFDINPKYFDFGNIKYGTETVSAQFTVTNVSDEYIANPGRFFFKTSEQQYIPGEYREEHADENSIFKFELSELRLNHPFAPKETRRFTVLFTPDRGGAFTDSIGIGDYNDCVYFYQAEVRVNVVNPQIYVTDAHFGDIIVGEVSEAKTVTITNNGTTELNIFNYDGPALNVFTTEGLQELNINPENPWIIESNSSNTFQVRFSPENVESYSDEIYFHSDADVEDFNYKPFSILTGRGIQPGLTANSYDWQRKRANITRYSELDYINIMPYSAENETITLKNVGTADVIIESIQVDESINGEYFFGFENNEYIPLIDYLQNIGEIRLSPDEYMYIPVFFAPIIEGEHLLSLNYISNSPDVVVSVLQGIGIYPEIIGSEVNFPTLYLGNNAMSDFGSIETKQIQISSQNYLDIAEIYDLEIVSGPVTFNLSEINNSENGSAVFYVDKSKFAETLALNPHQANRIVELPIVFSPGYAGDFSAKLKTVSDAYAEAEIIINGKSILERPILDVPAVYACIGSYAYSPVKITNTGSISFNLTDIEIDNQPIFEIEDDFLDRLPILIPVGEELEIPIKFTPILANQELTAEIIIHTDLSEIQYKIMYAQIKGISTNYLRNSISSVLKESNNADADATVLSITPGDKFSYSILITNSSEAMTYSDLSRLEVIIDYDRSFLAADLNNLSAVKLSNELIANSWKVVNISKSMTKQEQTVITLEGNPLKLQEGFLLMQINFSVYLPSIQSGFTADNIVYESSITHQILPYKSDGTAEICVEFNSTEVNVFYIPVCADSLRQLVVSNNEFYLSEIYPNPIGIEGAEVSFSIGIPLNADLNLYNSAGELVNQLSSGYLGVGIYSIRLETEMLPSGVYYLELNAGHFNERKQIVISK